MTSGDETPVDARRLSRETINQLGGFETPLLSDVVGREHTMDAGIKPIADGSTIAGPALTVDSVPADNRILHEAIASAREGDVLVVDADGYPEAGIWGELMAVAASKRGIAGTIIDGGVRDVVEVSEMGFPLFARHVSPKGSNKQQDGAINAPIVCGGVHVQRGDVMVGDANGVVAIPRDEAVDVIQACRRKEEKENQYRESGDVIEMYVDDS